MIRKYFALLRRAFAATLEYRVAMLIWWLTMSLPLVMLAVWLTLAQEGPIGGYNAGDFIAYYVLAMYMRQMTSVWVAWELDNDIRHGELAIKLLHPLNPIHEYISFNLIDKVLRFTVMTPIILLVAWLVPDVHFAVSPLNLIFFTLALVMAWYLRYMQQYIVGLLAFWISQSQTIQDIIFAVFLLLGGLVAPISLLPPWLVTVANYLPFRFMLSFPIEIMLGRLTTTELLVGFATSLGWCLVLQILYVIVWRRGLSAFQAFGA